MLNLNNFSSKSNSNKADKSRHPTSHYWFLESLIGLTGAILNSSVLYIFYIERQNMISTVNVMTRQGIFITDSLISQLLFSAFTRFFDSCIALLHYGGTSWCFGDQSSELPHTEEKWQNIVLLNQIIFIFDNC